MQAGVGNGGGAAAALARSATALGRAGRGHMSVLRTHAAAAGVALQDALRAAPAQASAISLTAAFKFAAVDDDGDFVMERVGDGSCAPKVDDGAAVPQSGDVLPVRDPAGLCCSVCAARWLG